MKITKLIGWSIIGMLMIIVPQIVITSYVLMPAMIKVTPLIASETMAPYVAFLIGFCGAALVMLVMQIIFGLIAGRNWTIYLWGSSCAIFCVIVLAWLAGSQTWWVAVGNTVLLVAQTCVAKLITHMIRVGRGIKQMKATMPLNIAVHRPSGTKDAAFEGPL